MENWKEALWATLIVITIALVFHFLSNVALFMVIMKVFVYSLLWIAVYAVFLDRKRS